MSENKIFQPKAILSPGKTLVPLLLLLLCPPFVILIWHTNIALEGSFSHLFRNLVDTGPFTYIWTVWKPVFWGSGFAWTALAIFAGIQLLFMRLLPGKTVNGPETPMGNIPAYKNNGFLSYTLSLTLFASCGWVFQLFSPASIYDHLGEILGALNIFSLLFCLVLYFKGLIIPSSSDNGSSGNPIFDYYWGTELYPRILGWDVKQFTNSRFGMMAWPILILCYATKQHELYGLSDSMIVSVILQLVYVSVFFWYESGYFRTMDIQVDRGGFYLCWGCLVWVPAIYTSPAMYLVNYPNELGWFFSSLLILVGVAAIYSKTSANRQRFNVRSNDGNFKVWGKPAEYIRAVYKGDDGVERESILLTSGWWGVSRHYHYVGELTGALCWSLPGLFLHFMPYFYLSFLTILLFHRAYRDDIRCANKYGKYWTEYKKKVPYKIIPYIY